MSGDAQLSRRASRLNAIFPWDVIGNILDRVGNAIITLHKSNKTSSGLKARVNRNSSTNKTKKKQEVQESDNGDSKPKQGKRRNPDYTQAGFYIRKDLQRKVKGLLLDEEDIDFSDLINNLLQEWVNKHQSD